MRKLLLAVAVLSLSFYACKKDTAPTKQTPPVKDGQKYAVTISVKDFLAKTEPLSKKTKGAAGARDTALAGMVSHLHYLIYDQYTALIRDVVQVADSTPDFGSYVDSLYPDQYMVIVVASTGPLDLLNKQNYYELRTNFAADYGPDVFFAFDIFTVDSTMSDPAELYMIRQTGKLEVNIKDAPGERWPGDDLVHVYVRPAYRQYGFFRETLSDSIPGFGMGFRRDNFTHFSTHMISNADSVDVTIVYPDKQTWAPLTKVIHNVPYNRGYRTVLTGTVYNQSPSPEAFQIVLDTAWNNHPEIPF